MSFSVASLNLLPVAGGLANQAFQASQQLGTGFVDVLSSLTNPAALDQTLDHSNSVEASEITESHHAGKTSEWCQKLVQWLQDHNFSSDVKLQIGLDRLDQPQVSAYGQSATAIEQAIEQDPTLLQEFRELALDRMAERISGRAPLLNITQQDGKLRSEWT